MEPCNALATELGKLPTPYSYEGFRSALDHCKLTNHFPNLVHDIRFGSPIGAPAPLTCTTIFPNLPSASLQPTVVDAYISNEITLGRMSGPFSRLQTHSIIGGHFRTVPIGLVPKSGEKFRMVQNLSKKDSFGVSVNSQLSSDDFPTCWFSAWSVANYVSPCYY
jgi:hypothetical protein